MANISYTQFTYNVTATGSTTTLEFKAYSTAATSTYLDDVNVTAADAPEAPALLMSAMGLLGLGLAKKRRRA